MKLQYHSYGCPIRYGLGIFGDRWSLLIIRDLIFKNRKNYSEFLDAGEGISTNILADRLRRLESNGILLKSRDPENRKKFIYELSPKGLDLIPIMLSIINWAEKYDDRSEVPKEFIEKVRLDQSDVYERLRSRLDSSFDSKIVVESN